MYFEGVVSSNLVEWVYYKILGSLVYTIYTISYQKSFLIVETA